VDRGPRLWHLRAVLLRCIEACVYSSLWLAAAAAALTAAAGQALAACAEPRCMWIAACGTLVVYNVDRLRDMTRDRVTAPERTAFVEAWRSGLVALSALAALVAGVLALGLDTRAALLLAPILALGLLHRRLKHAAYLKSMYVTGAWLAVVVGLPWSTAPQASQPGWVLACVGSAILANAIASNLRDAEAGAARIGATRALAIARSVAVLGIATALLAPPEARGLAALPGAMLVVLLRFRPTERYGLFQVDGALLVGALLALVL